MTETTPVNHVNPFHVGPARWEASGSHLRHGVPPIVDLEDGVTDMPVGERGELIVKGPQICSATRAVRKRRRAR
jgi:long-chain acyl-CoA synthetase